MSINNLRADVETQPRTLKPPGPFATVESLEDSREFPSREAYTFVADADGHLALAGIERDLDAPALWRILDGVCHQVTKDLLDAALVPNPLDPLRRGQQQLVPLGGCLGFTDDMSRDGDKIGRNRVELEAAGFKP
jgi:hypothetical protein